MLCATFSASDDADALVVWRGDTCVVMLNRFPYANGHIMVVPTRHVADLTDLTSAESQECQALISKMVLVLRQTMSPEGFNVGLNLGAAAGAGIASHLHWHVVPRWSGDTNFMPVLADIAVMPQHLAATHKLLRDGFLAHVGVCDNQGASDHDVAPVSRARDQDPAPTSTPTSNEQEPQ